MFQAKAKVLVMIVGFAAAVIVAGATTLPRTAPISGTGGFIVNGCSSNSGPFACPKTLGGTQCSGTDIFCSGQGTSTCYIVPGGCYGSTGCVALESSCCDCSVAGPIEGK
jgi:hypothetical protein